MKFREQTLEDIIWVNAQTEEGREILYERGLDINGKIYRQLDLGSYGRLDLLTVEFSEENKCILFTIYELKKDEIRIDALLQAFRYLTALKRHFENGAFKVRIRLIGEKIYTSDNFAYLYNEIYGVEIYTFNYTIEGLYFEEVGKGWYQTNEVLNEETKEMIDDDVNIIIKERNERLKK